MNKEVINMKKSIILIGAPCVGKSTIGKNLQDILGIKYISSGDIARSMGDDVNELINSGNLAPEEMMRKQILKIISGDEPFILDGFPRNLSQLEFLKQNTNHELIFVVLKASSLILKNRSLVRGRSDDKSFDKRFTYFMNEYDMVDEICGGIGYNVAILYNEYNNDMEYNIKHIVRLYSFGV